MKHSMDIAFKTDEGCVRKLNEDTVQAGLLDGSSANPWLFDAYIVVADGMGGHEGGEVASRLAVDMVQQIFASDQSPRHVLEEVSGQDLLHRLYAAVRDINRAVYENGQGEGTARAGTTLTLCLARRHEYCVAHVGDSRAYLVRADSIEQVTADDSWVAEAVRRGLMTEEAARNSEFRNRITKAIGLQDDIESSVYYGHWQPGDLLLVCSDGLSEYIPAPELLALVHRRSSLEQLCHECIRLSRERGGHDNISIAVVTQPLAQAQAGAQTTSIGKLVTWPPDGNALTDSSGSPRQQKHKATAGITATSISWNRRQIRWLAIALLLLLTLLLAGAWAGLRRGAAQGKATGQVMLQEFRLRALPPLAESGQVSERQPVRQRGRKENSRQEPSASAGRPNASNKKRGKEEGRRRNWPDRKRSFSQRQENPERGASPVSVRLPSRVEPQAATPPSKPVPVKPSPPITDRSITEKPAADKFDTAVGNKKSQETAVGEALDGVEGDKSSSAAPVASVSAGGREQEKTKAIESSAASSAVMEASPSPKPAQGKPAD